MHDPPTIALKKGLLIAVEGIDGSGKSVQARMLAGYLRDGLKLNVTHDKEPTDGPAGARLRASATAGRLSRDEEIRLFHDDRREHVATVIAPRLAAGDVVILDRYYYSTAAYQGRDVADARALVAENETFAPRPDVAIVLDLPPSTAAARLERRGGTNHFETPEWLESSRALFLALWGPEVRVINGAESPEVLAQRILYVLHPVLAARLIAVAADTARSDSALAFVAIAALRQLVRGGRPSAAG